MRSRTELSQFLRIFLPTYYLSVVPEDFSYLILFRSILHQIVFPMPMCVVFLGSLGLLTRRERIWGISEGLYRSLKLTCLLPFKTRSSPFLFDLTL